MPKHYAIHGEGIYQGDYNSIILPKVHGRNVIWKGFAIRGEAEIFMAFVNPHDARACGLAQQLQRNRVGATVTPIQRPRPRAQDFFELPPASPPTPTPPTPTVQVPTPTSPAIVDTTGDLSDDGYESAGNQVPHVNRDRYDGAFAVQQIKELNSTLRGVDTELQALRAQNKAVLIGPVLVRKAQTISALIQARFLRLALGSADTEALTRSHLGKLRQQNTEVWPLVNEAITAHRREIAGLKTELHAEESSLKQAKKQLPGTGRPSPTGRSLGSFLQGEKR